MKKPYTFLLFFTLILLFSCSNGFFGKKENTAKPYYFSTLKQRPAYHIKKPEKTVNPISGSDYVAHLLPSYDSLFADSLPETEVKSIIKTSAKQENNPKLQANINHNKTNSEDQKPGLEKVRPAKENKSDNWFLAGAALFSVLTASVFSLFIPRAKSLAGWAKENKKAARFTIATGHIIIGFGGYFIGRKLAEYGVATSEVSTYSLLGFAGLAALAYPEKNQNGWVKYTFRRNKILPVLVILSGFLLFLNIGNREVTDKDFNPTTKLVSEAAGSNLYADWQEKINVESESKPKDFWHVLLDILLIALALLVVFFLMTVIAFLSCTIACSGSPLIASVVLLGGTALCLYFMYMVIKRISGKARIRKGKTGKEELKTVDTQPAKKEKPNPPKEKQVPFKEKYKWF